MYIGNIISHLRGWTILNTQYGQMLTELELLLSDLPLPCSGTYNLTYNNRPVHRCRYNWKEFRNNYREALLDLNWKPDESKFHLNGIRDGVSINIWLGKQQFALTELFAAFPLIIKLQKLDLAVFLVPEKSIAPMGGVTFESISESLTELAPLSLDYPFVVLGLGTEKTVPQVKELTSPINFYLLNSIGYTLEEAISLGESSSYEFKEQLPQNTVLSQEICGFANTRGGGIILLGISDSGEIPGIDSDQLDSIQLKILNITRDTCHPVPTIEFFKFELADGKMLLAVQVAELKQKPCLTSGRAYIRVGPSARMATSEEIRNLILA